jgi:two-component system, OmpR family, response regulator
MMRPFLDALSYHILVVENEPGLYEMIRATLECDGFHVTFTPKKAAAMSLLSSLKIDLVVVDVNLPDGLGTEVAQYAASLTIPSILMTGHPKHIMEFDQKDIAYIAKPFGPEQLRQEVRHRLTRADPASSDLLSR